jgi:hypothetical protein
LDGVRDLDALRRNARRHIPDLEIDVADALAPLIEAGAVVDQPEPRRPALRVEIAHDGPSARLARSVGRLLRSLGVSVGADADVLVVLSSGEPDRTALADVVRCGVSHLVVVQDVDAVRIGPMVVPGRTPCVGCADLHRCAWDPGWSALLPQFGRAIRSGVPRLALHTAAAEIAAACAAFAEKPLADVIEVGPDRTVRTVAVPAFHPRCSCSLLCVG